MHKRFGDVRTHYYDETPDGCNRVALAGLLATVRECQRRLVHLDTTVRQCQWKKQTELHYAIFKNGLLYGCKTSCVQTCLKIHFLEQFLLTPYWNHWHLFLPLFSPLQTRKKKYFSLQYFPISKTALVFGKFRGFTHWSRCLAWGIGGMILTEENPNSSVFWNMS